MNDSNTPAMTPLNEPTLLVSQTFETLDGDGSEKESGYLFKNEEKTLSEVIKQLREHPTDEGDVFSFCCDEAQDPSTGWYRTTWIHLAHPHSEHDEELWALAVQKSRQHEEVQMVSAVDTSTAPKETMVLSFEEWFPTLRDAMSANDDDDGEDIVDEFRRSQGYNYFGDRIGVLYLVPGTQEQKDQATQDMTAAGEEVYSNDLIDELMQPVFDPLDPDLIVFDCLHPDEEGIREPLTQVVLPYHEWQQLISDGTAAGFEKFKESLRLSHGVGDDGTIYLVPPTQEQKEKSGMAFHYQTQKIFDPLKPQFICLDFHEPVATQRIVVPYDDWMTILSAEMADDTGQGEFPLEEFRATLSYRYFKGEYGILHLIPATQEQKDEMLNGMRESGDYPNDDFYENELMTPVVGSNCESFIVFQCYDAQKGVPEHIEDMEDVSVGPFEKLSPTRPRP